MPTAQLILRWLVIPNSAPIWAYKIRFLPHRLCPHTCNKMVTVSSRQTISSTNSNSSSNPLLSNSHNNRPVKGNMVNIRPVLPLGPARTRSRIRNQSNRQHLIHGSRVAINSTGNMEVVALAVSVDQAQVKCRIYRTSNACLDSRHRNTGVRSPILSSIPK